MSKLSFIRKGGVSTRYHTEDMLIRQDIASHSFGVAWFCELLTAGKARKVLIMAALAHDLAEHRTGDIPSPAKRRLGVGDMFHQYEMEEINFAGLGSYFEELTEGEELVLKLADMMDGMAHCIRERNLGNRNVIVIFWRFLQYTKEAMDKSKRAEAATSFSFDEEIAASLISELEQEWSTIV